MPVVNLDGWIWRQDGLLREIRGMSLLPSASNPGSDRLMNRSG